MVKSLEEIRAGFPIDEKKLRSYGALSFAYIGDCVYDLVIKTMIVSREYERPGHYHDKAIHYVNAAGQAEMMKAIKPLLSEEEKKIYKRGKNAKPFSQAKNQTPHDYRVATGFEALIGYLYLNGRQDRILELISYGLEEEEKSTWHTKNGL